MNMAGRVEKIKQYVKCVLASLTSEMVRERVCFTRNPDHTRREASKQILLRLAGKAFGSSWIGDMMPGRKQEESVLFTKEVSGTRNLGYQELIAGNEMTKKSLFDSNRSVWEKKGKRHLLRLMRLSGN